MSESGWYVESRAGIRHVLPTADGVRHETGTGGCPCGTERIKPKTGLPVVLHSVICPPMPHGLPADYE